MPNRIVVFLFLILLTGACQSKQERYIIGTWIAFDNTTSQISELSIYKLDHRCMYEVRENLSARNNLDTILLITPVYENTYHWHIQDSLVENTEVVYQLSDLDTESEISTDALVYIDTQTYESFKAREFVVGTFRPQMEYQRIYTSLWGVE